MEKKDDKAVEERRGKVQQLAEERRVPFFQCSFIGSESEYFRLLNFHLQKKNIKKLEKNTLRSCCQ